MAKRKQSHPRKRVSTIVYKGYTPKRYGSRKKRSIIPGLNYGRQRCVGVYPINSLAAALGFNIIIPWQQTGIAHPPPGTTYHAYGDTPRFASTRPNWDQYAITSMKVEWLPLYNVAAPTTGNICQTLQKVDDLDSYATMGTMTSNAIISAPGFKNLNPHRTWKKFYSFKKISKQQNVPWQDNSAYVANAANTLTKAATMLAFGTVNQPQSHPIGTLKVTWYVKMRGQVNA